MRSAFSITYIVVLAFVISGCGGPPELDEFTTLHEEIKESLGGDIFDTSLSVAEKNQILDELDTKIGRCIEIHVELDGKIPAEKSKAMKERNKLIAGGIAHARKLNNNTPNN
ncbi:MAG: hypothetical protein P1U89_02225 [Verrucomicrobiales bacterium]|nr:hypothetical protein [Verrucomicrobiales bacterium]